MKFARENEKFIRNAYEVQMKSTYQIADELGTYSSKIRRALDYLGIERRDYRQAQKNAIDSGRHKKPERNNLKPTEEELAKRSRSIRKSYEALPESEKALRRERAKIQWEQKSEVEKIMFSKMGAAALRESAKEGSKLEKHVRQGLVKSGYKVEYHKRDLLSEQLELDLYLPDLKTVVEIDGVAHFEPIWGEEALNRSKRSHAKKSGLLLSHGFVLIRVKNMARQTTLRNRMDTLDAVLAEVRKIEEKFPPRDERYIEIEIEV